MSREQIEDELLKLYDDNLKLKGKLKKEQEDGKRYCCRALSQHGVW